MTSTKPPSVEDIKAATAALVALRGTMSSAKPLTDAQRREYWRKRMGPQTLRALVNRVAAAQQHRHLLPPSFDLRKFERDTALVGALQECLAAIDSFQSIVQDSLLPVASRAVQAGNIVYALIKASPGAEEQIKRSIGKLSVSSSRTRAESQGEPPVAVPSPTTTGAAPPASGSPAPSGKDPENKAA